MKQFSEISNYRALADTSSVVAHDISAQLHVQQFCIEELSQHIGKGGQEYLAQLQKGSAYLSELLNSFRRQLKINFSPDKPANLEQVFEAVLELVKNHYYSHMNHLKFEFDQTSDQFEIGERPLELMHKLFAVSSFLSMK